MKLQPRVNIGVNKLWKQQFRKNEKAFLNVHNSKLVPFSLRLISYHVLFVMCVNLIFNIIKQLKYNQKDGSKSIKIGQTVTEKFQLVKLNRMVYVRLLE